MNSISIGWEWKMYALVNTIAIDFCADSMNHSHFRSHFFRIVYLYILSLTLFIFLKLIDHLPRNLTLKKKITKIEKVFSGT